jgi:hypothetical protein
LKATLSPTLIRDGYVTFFFFVAFFSLFVGLAKIGGLILLFKAIYLNIYKIFFAAILEWVSGNVPETKTDGAVTAAEVLVSSYWHANIFPILQHLRWSPLF